MAGRKRGAAAGLKNEKRKLAELEARRAELLGTSKHVQVESASPRNWRVYGLVDPETNQLRYVGMTGDPAIREIDHLVSQTATVTEQTRLGDWIRKLRRLGQTPRLVWMESCPDEASCEIAEEFWIAYHRAREADDLDDWEKPADLLNKLDGGNAIMQACFVSLFEGWVVFDGRRWRYEQVLKKKTSIATVRAETIYQALGVECVPDADVTFERDGHTWLNVYVTPRVVPKPGPYPRIQRLLECLTDGDQQAIEYVKGWLSRKVKEPGQRNMTALVFQGSPGTGKDTLGLIAQAMIGEENCATILQPDLGSNFNSHFVKKLLVVANEVVSKEGIYDPSDPLKHYITNATVRCEQKHVTTMEVPNRMSWIFNSNSTIPVKVEAGDRRYSVFSNMVEPSAEYRDLIGSCYARSQVLSDEFVSTEVAGFMHELAKLEVDLTSSPRPYENEARRLVARSSRSATEVLAEELQEYGLEFMMRKFHLLEIPADIDLARQGTVKTELLYNLYGQLATEHGLFKTASTKFFGELKKCFPEIKKSRPTGPKRAAGDTRADRFERFWVYDNLPTSPADPDAPVKKPAGLEATLFEQEMIRWGREWIAKNPERENMVAVATALHFGQERPIDKRKFDPNWSPYRAKKIGSKSGKKAPESKIDKLLREAEQKEEQQHHVPESQSVDLEKRFNEMVNDPDGNGVFLLDQGKKLK